jgi:DNA-binding transcriptional MerR regulator
MAMTDPVTLPEGQDSFKLNEVCKLAGVQPYMLRFWGTEFPQLEAQRTGTGQRVYRREQVEVILEVRHLLFDEGLTVAGVKRRLQAEQKDAEVEAKKPARRAKRPEPKALQPADEAPVMPTVQANPDPAASPADLAAEVDKAAQERVQPLLATLREVREELTQLVATLEGTKQK